MADSFNFDEMLKDFRSAVGQLNNKTNPFDSQAEVLRVEGDTAWVHIPGGVDETPVKLTTNAKAGDVVQVRVAGGRAWLYGNQTSPPTDDTVAKAAKKQASSAEYEAVEAGRIAGEAQISAYKAESAANEAIADAASAKSSAESAQTSAEEAERNATQAQTSADEAADGAREANMYARTALSTLADVEDVVDALGWISEHGTYAATSDIQVDTNKSYFKLTSTNTFERVAVPVSTYIRDMYEKVDTAYYLPTEDTAVVSGKTYYEYDSVNDEYVVVSNPTDAGLPYYFERYVETTYVLTSDTSVVSGKTYYAYDPIANTYTSETPTATIGAYYELMLDESVRNYLLTHLTMTDSGLEVTRDGNSYRMIIASDRILLKNELGAVIASYSDEIVLGEAANGIRNVITSTRMSFQTDSGDVAYFGLNEQNIWEMHIDTAYVDDMMRFGNYAWIRRDNGNMTLKWLGA